MSLKSRDQVNVSDFKSFRRNLILTYFESEMAWDAYNTQTWLGINQKRVIK